MKNEIFLRAMSEIDDDLLAAAQAAGKKRRTLRPALAAAACLVLLVGALLTYRGLGPGIRINGAAPGSDPILIDTPALMSLDPPSPRTPPALTVPLELSGSGRSVSLSAEQGTLSVFNTETDALIFEGVSGKFDCPLRLEWTVTRPTPGETYRLTVGRTVLSLAFEDSLGCWCVTKE